MLGISLRLSDLLVYLTAGLFEAKRNPKHLPRRLFSSIFGAGAVSGYIVCLSHASRENNDRLPYMHPCDSFCQPCAACLHRRWILDGTLPLRV